MERFRVSRKTANCKIRKFQSFEQIEKKRVSCKRYHQEHPDAAKEWHSTPEARANNRAAQKKYHQEHPGIKIGKNNPNWQGGISNLPYPFEFNKEFCDCVRERYDYTCVICKRRQEQLRRKLDVHHIDYDKDNLDLDNFVSLCESCHSATKGKNNRAYWTMILQNIVEMNKRLLVT